MELINKIKEAVTNADLSPSNIKKAAGAAAGVYLAYKWYKFMNPSYLTFSCDGKGRVVVISGCDTGFGNVLAPLLDEHGFRVYAMCLTDKGIQEMTDKLSSRSVAVKCDITRQEHIDSLAEQIKSRRERIWAVVNNAGIGNTAVIEALQMSDFRKVMEVNFMGHVAVTKALLPMVSRGGRIVNMASIAGRTTMLHGYAAYCASKHAMEAFSDILRLEMKAFGIKVSTLEPVFHATALIADMVGDHRRIFARAPPSFHERYGKEWEDWVCMDLGRQNLHGVSDGPEAVVRAYFHAIGAEEPLVRYKIGKGANIGIGIGMLPDSLFDKLYGMSVPKDAVLPLAARE